jgi:YHS domain-containing protein
MFRGAAFLTLAVALFACARRESTPGRAEGPRARVADPAALAALIPPYEEQAATYTVKTCLVCGMSLASVKKPVDVVQDGKLVRFCSDGCARTFEKNPVTILAQRDSLLIATQLPTYPTDKCIVTDDKIESLGTPTNMLWGTRLVRLCCKNCVEQFKENPGDFIAALDALSDVKAVEAGGQPPATHAN